MVTGDVPPDLVTWMHRVGMAEHGGLIDILPVCSR